MYTSGSASGVQIEIYVSNEILLFLNVFCAQSPLDACHISFRMTQGDFDRHIEKSLLRHTDLKKCTILSGFFDTKRSFANNSYTVKNFACIFVPSLKRLLQQH